MHSIATLRSVSRRLWLRACWLWFCLYLGACQAGYYGHLVKGHVGMMSAREPVARVLKGDSLTPHQRQLLELSGALLDFAEQELQLPAAGVYRHYVALEEDWVVWNLFAAPEFSLTPYQWCYPVVGCAAYRGFFSRQRAEREQQRLEQDGWQVFGAGAIAYSTLGWFRDPLTSAMLQGDEVWFAELLFHELVHRRYYLKGDTRFNESLATAVAQEGLRRWLARHDDPNLIGRVREREAARTRFLDLVGTARQALAELYASGTSAEEMRQQRQLILTRLREAFARARQQQPALGLWQEWIDGPLNNAQFNMVSDYHDQVPVFEAALLACGGDWPCFWKRVDKLAAARKAALAEDHHD